MKIFLSILLVIVLAAAGALAGWRFAPLCARTHLYVRQADQLRLEKSDPAVKPNMLGDSFRASGMKLSQVNDRADAVERAFTVGTPIFGAWCGIVFAAVIIGLYRTHRHNIFEINYDNCVACGRCFTSCPREKLRLKLLAKKRESGT